MKRKVVLMAFLICMTVFAKDIQWIKIDGTFQDISVGPSEKFCLWAASSDGIYRFDGKSWVEKIPDKTDGQVKRVITKNDCLPMIIHQSGIVYELTVEKKWQKLAGITARELVASSNGEIFAIGKDIKKRIGLFQWNGSKWIFWSSGAEKVAVDSEGTPWIIDGKNKIYKYYENKWQEWPGEALDISISRNGNLWIISNKKFDLGYDIAEWEDNQWKYQQISANRITIDPWGRPWIVNYSGELFMGKIN